MWSGWWGTLQLELSFNLIWPIFNWIRSQFSKRSNYLWLFCLLVGKTIYEVLPWYLQTQEEINGNIITFTLRRVTAPSVMINTNKPALSNKRIFIWSIWRITHISYYFIILIFILVNGKSSIFYISRCGTQNLFKAGKRTWSKDKIVRQR